MPMIYFSFGKGESNNQRRRQTGFGGAPVVVLAFFTLHQRQNTSLLFTAQRWCKKLEEIACISAGTMPSFKDEIYVIDWCENTSLGLMPFEGGRVRLLSASRFKGSRRILPDYFMKRACSMMLAATHSLKTTYSPFHPLLWAHSTNY